MFPYSNALSLIDQLGLGHDRAWIGNAPPPDISFAEFDLYRQPGFRCRADQFGLYSSVWILQEAIALQGWRILLDSCIRMLSEHGVLIVRYVQNQHISIPALKSFLFRKYGIRVNVCAEIIGNGEFITAFQIHRDITTLRHEKTWSFGVLTQGKKVEFVAEFCRSVRQLGGAAHEILIVGPRNAAYDIYNPVYVEKTYSAIFSDICVKKNDIVDLANHENICILHDRYILSEDFFSGFDTFGYDFDFLTIRQHHASGKIYPSYCAMEDSGHLIWGPIFECGNENETWDRHYLNGGLIIAKRSLLKTVPFNSLIFHNQAEDVELARVMESISVLPRINRLSSAVTDVADHLTEAFAFSNHPGDAPFALGATAAPLIAVTERAPPVLVADVTAVPWRRVRAICRRVENIRRDGGSWGGVASAAARFVRRRALGKWHASSIAESYAEIIAGAHNAESRGRPDNDQGCNIILYAGKDGGVLNLTVHYLRALERRNIPFCIVAIDHEAAKSVLPVDLTARILVSPIYPQNIWCIGFPYVEDHLTAYKMWAANRWNVVFTHWELPYIPSRLAYNFKHLDGVMVTSEFVRDAVKLVTALPIELVDPEVSVDTSAIAIYDRDYFNLPRNKKLFLLNWEFTSSTIRKNPQAAMRAFEEAFSGMSDSVGLVMHIKFDDGENAENQVEYDCFLAQAKIAYPNLIVLARRSYTYEETLGLKMVCDCFVSLHRSEGYGMGCAEALALQRRCIMTAWSGNMELLKKTEWSNRIYPVTTALVRVKPSDFPWVMENDDVFQLWADVRHGDAVRQMRKVYADINLERSACANVI